MKAFDLLLFSSLSFLPLVNFVPCSSSLATQHWRMMHKMSIPSDTPLSHHQIEGNIPEKKKQKLKFIFFFINWLTVSSISYFTQESYSTQIPEFTRAGQMRTYSRLCAEYWGSVILFIRSFYIWSIFIRNKVYTDKIYMVNFYTVQNLYLKKFIFYTVTNVYSRNQFYMINFYIQTATKFIRSLFIWWILYMHSNKVYTVPHIM